MQETPSGNRRVTWSIAGPCEGGNGHDHLRSKEYHEDPECTIDSANPGTHLDTFLTNVSYLVLEPKGCSLRKGYLLIQVGVLYVPACLGLGDYG